MQSFLVYLVSMPMLLLLPISFIVKRLVDEILLLMHISRILYKSTCSWIVDLQLLFGKDMSEYL